MMDVTDIPLWTDHHRRIPKKFQVRANAELVVIVYQEGTDIWHVSCDRAVFDAKAVKPMLNNLKGAVFETKHPGLHLKFINDQVEVVNGGISLDSFVRKYHKFRKDLKFAGICATLSY